MIFVVALMKLSIVFLLSIAVFQLSDQKKYNVGHFVVGWMMQYMGQIFVLLLFSVNCSLSQVSLMIALVTFLILCIVINLIIAKKQKSRKSIDIAFNTEGWAAYGVLIFAAGYLIVRSLYCFDPTHDAMVYGMPRILLFAQKGSILTNMDTRVINIFSNEWNGELNAVFYRIIVGNNQAIPFANVENYLYGISGIAYCCYRMFAEERVRKWVLAAYMINPVLFFMAMTCKGDFLPMILLPLFFVCAYRALCEENDIQHVLMMLLSGSLCAGSKITMVPCVGLMMVAFLIRLILQRKFRVFAKVLGMCFPIYVIGCLRYVVNFFQYGNFFQRVEVENEKLSFSLQKMFDSFRGVSKDFFVPKNVFLFDETYYVVNSDSGYALVTFLVIAVIAILVHLKWFKKLVNKTHILFAGVLVFCVVFMMCTTIYYPYSYRYYFPFVGIAVMGLLSVSESVCDKSGGRAKGLWRESVVLASMIGICCCALWNEKPGDVTNVDLVEMSKKQGIEREMGINYWLLENSAGENDIYDFYNQIREGKKVLICLEINQICAYLFGDNNGNDVTMCDLQGLETLWDDGWDVISVSTRFDVNYEEILEQRGYTCYEPYYLEQKVFVKEEG